MDRTMAKLRFVTTHLSSLFLFSYYSFYQAINLFAFFPSGNSAVLLFLLFYFSLFANPWDSAPSLATSEDGHTTTSNTTRKRTRKPTGRSTCKPTGRSTCKPTDRFTVNALNHKGTEYIQHEKFLLS